MSSSGERMFVLYDIPSQHPGNAWSPNGWKARFVLNYKGLPYRTVWLEYPEIEPTLKALGAQPTIAKYLDDTYPDTPPVAPKATRGLTRAVHRAIPRDHLSRLIDFMVASVQLNPASVEFYRTKNSSDVPFDELVPKDPEEREQIWKDIQKEINMVEAYYAENTTGSGWIMGESPTFIDFVLGGQFMFAKLTIKDEFEAHIEKWHDGRWTKLMDALEEYSVVH